MLSVFPLLVLAYFVNLFFSVSTSGSTMVFPADSLECVKI